MIQISLLFAVIAQGPTQSIWPPLRETDRAVLEEFYRATGGDTWKERKGWNSTTNPCDWYGVWCDVEFVDARQIAVVAGLSLADNGLHGTLPQSLPTLSGLHRIDVSNNALGGRVPETILTRWDNDDLDFYAHGNQFENLVSRASLRSSSSLLCGVDDDVNFTLDVREDGTALFQSVRCAGQGRRTYCFVRDGRGPALTRLSRALNLLRFRELSVEYSYRYGFTTHGTDLTTTVWFGNGESKTVATYDRQGPLEAWSAQQMFLGLLSEMTWVKERRLKRCDGI